MFHAHMATMRAVAGFLQCASPVACNRMGSQSIACVFVLDEPPKNSAPVGLPLNTTKRSGAPSN